MKKLFCMLCCAMLALSAVSCALAAEAGELATGHVPQGLPAHRRLGRLYGNRMPTATDLTTKS